MPSLSLSPRPPEARRPPALVAPIALEAIEFVSPTAAVVERPAPLGARSTIWTVAALFASTLALLGLVPVERLVATSGRVVSTAPTVTIQPIETAIVRSVEVRANQVVRAGEVVARLDPTFAASDANALESQVLALRAEVARLEAETSGQAWRPDGSAPAVLQAAIFAQRRAELAARLENYGQRAAGFRSTMERSQAEAAFLNRRLEVVTEVERMRRELARSAVGSHLNLLLATDARLEISRSIAATEGMARMAARDLAAVQAERDAFLEQWRSQAMQDLGARRTSLAEAEERLAAARLRRALVEMRAPMDAVVLELGKTAPGAVLQPGELLMSLVPLQAPLEVEAEIPARDMGYVARGDRVAIRLEAYNHMRHGLARGTVRTISEDALGREAGEPMRPPYYRARVTVDDLSGLRDLPADFRLMPGMPVAADIVVGERTILAYLFESALRTLSRGMREP